MGESPYGYDYSVFRGSSNHIITKALFEEFPVNSQKAGIKPIFTLREYDWNDCLSIRTLYLDIADPTEYEFAMAVFGSLDVWHRLKNATWFAETYELMKRDLEMKLQARGFRELEAKAEKSVDAAKYLANKGWTTKTPKKGRPTKQAIRQEAAAIARSDKDIDEDYERVLN